MMTPEVNRVGIYTSGVHFGLPGLLLMEKRPCTYTCISMSDLQSISKPDLEYALFEFPLQRQALLQEAAQTQRALDTVKIGLADELWHKRCVVFLSVSVLVCESVPLPHPRSLRCARYLDAQDGDEETRKRSEAFLRFTQSTRHPTRMGRKKKSMVVAKKSQSVWGRFKTMLKHLWHGKPEEDNFGEVRRRTLAAAIVRGSSLS